MINNGVKTAGITTLVISGAATGYLMDAELEDNVSTLESIPSIGEDSIPQVVSDPVSKPVLVSPNVLTNTYVIKNLEEKTQAKSAEAQNLLENMRICLIWAQEYRIKGFGQANSIYSNNIAKFNVGDLKTFEEISETKSEFKKHLPACSV